MRSKNEIKDYIARYSEKYLLAEWCSPDSLNLNELQIRNLLSALEAQLLPHLAAAKQLILSLQASSDSPSGSKLASVQVYSLYSNNALMSFTAKIVAEHITLIAPEVRSLANIRKTSLQEKATTTVIIIDDDHSIIKILTRWIQSQMPEYEILSADKPEDGIKLYKANFHCRCIFMDIQMPGMNGFEASKCIREFENHHELTPCPIIFMSADSSLKDEIINILNTTFCTKPLNKFECLDKLAEITADPMLESCNGHSPK